jgi:hypothetical protein
MTSLFSLSVRVTADVRCMRGSVAILDAGDGPVFIAAAPLLGLGSPVVLFWGCCVGCRLAGGVGTAVLPPFFAVSRTSVTILSLASFLLTLLEVTTFHSSSSCFLGEGVGGFSAAVVERLVAGCSVVLCRVSELFNKWPPKRFSIALNMKGLISSTLLYRSARRADHHYFHLQFFGDVRGQ